MKNAKELLAILCKLSENEAKKLKQSYRENNNIDDYLYKMSEKIFKKLVFPYFRFEILLRSIENVVNNDKYSIPMKEKDKKRINIIFAKLQKICAYLNIALDEYNKMLFYIKKPKNT